MQTNIEQDANSVDETTMDDWHGLKELNQPLPKWWIYILYATMVWSAAYFVLYPSVPWFNTYFHGILGYSTRDGVDADVAAVARQRAVYMDRIKAMSYADIRKDPQLMAVAQTAGRIAFAENCQPCHGAGGGGNPGFPALAAGNWIWGGTLEDIQKTLTYGIRSAHDNTRQGPMPRFGVDAMLKPPEIQVVAEYVMTLYGTPVAGKDTAAGAALFAENCAVCHGDNAQGNRELGAPRLASRAHLYGDDLASVIAQINNPKLGMMPAWNARLDEGTIKALTLFVHGMGGGE